MKTKDLAQNICPTVSVWLFRGPGQDWLFTLVGFAPWKSTGPGTLKPPGATWSKSSGAQDQPQSPPRVRVPSQGPRRELALSVPMAGAPSLFLSMSFCSPPAWQIKASSGQVWSPAWAAATGLLQGICQQLVFWSADSRASLTPDRPCLACCHLPWYDVWRVVDTRFNVVSDDEMLHPWGQDLGDEGERVRESWRAGSQLREAAGGIRAARRTRTLGVHTWCPPFCSDSMYTTVLASLHGCHGKTGRWEGRQASRGASYWPESVTPNNHPLLPRISCLFIISIMPLATQWRNRMETQGIRTAEPGMGSRFSALASTHVRVLHDQHLLGIRTWSQRGSWPQARDLPQRPYLIRWLMNDSSGKKKGNTSPAPTSPLWSVHGRAVALGQAAAPPHEPHYSLLQHPRPGQTSNERQMRHGEQCTHSDASEGTTHGGHEIPAPKPSQVFGPTVC